MNRFSIIVICLLWGVLLPSVAKSAPIQPIGDWSVKKLSSGPENNDIPVQYCTLRVDFKNGDNLVIARDLAGAMTGAYQQHAKRLTPESHLPLVVYIDNNPVRRFRATAVNPSTLIFSISHDYDLVDLFMGGYTMALAGSGNFQQTYSLSGSADGFRALNDCLRNLNGGRALAWENAQGFSRNLPPIQRAMRQYSRAPAGQETYIVVHNSKAPSMDAPPGLEQAVGVTTENNAVASAEGIERTNVDKKKKDSHAISRKKTVAWDDKSDLSKPSEKPEINIEVMSPEDIQSRAVDKVDHGNGPTPKPARLAANHSYEAKEVFPEVSPEDDPQDDKDTSVAKNKGVQDTSPVNQSLATDKTECFEKGLDRVLTCDMKPALVKAGATTLKDNKSLQQASWQDGAVSGYFTSVPAVTDFNLLGQAVIADLEKACGGAFNKEEHKTIFKAGNWFKFYKVECEALDYKQSGLLYFIAHGEDTVLLSLESDYNHREALDKYQSAVKGVM